MAKESKSEALKSRLINNIGYCPQCGKKHPKGKHVKEKDEKSEGKEEKEEDEEENGDEK
jgi:uncharacterized protein with PIN domain